MTPDRSLQQRAKLVWRGVEPMLSSRLLAEEKAIALTFGASTNAVMMATPADLEDFAVGFSLTEGIVQSAAEIEELETVAGESGIELRMWLAAEKADAMTLRQRRLAGPSGCGLCGLESLADAVRPPPKVVLGSRFAPAAVHAAMAALSPAQKLNHDGVKAL